MTTFIADKVTPAQTTAQQSAQKMALLQKELNRDAAKEAADSTTSAHWITLALFCVCLAVGAAVLFVVRRTSTVLHRIAQNMAEGAERVPSAAMHASSASQSLAQGSSEQAASLEEPHPPARTSTP